MNNTTAARYWSDANVFDAREHGKRWQVARLAYAAYRIDAVKSRGAIKRLADDLALAQGAVYIEDKSPTDTVYRLIHAYSLFVELLKQDANKAKQYRRKYTYTRFDIVWLQFQAFEFSPDKFFDYLDYKGGNRAVAAFIENNEDPSPEWERRAITTYKQAYKLQNDFGVPDGLQKAAVNYVKEFEKWEQAERE